MTVTLKALGTAVLGAILQHYAHKELGRGLDKLEQDVDMATHPDMQRLKGAFKIPDGLNQIRTELTTKSKSETTTTFKYESRVMEGIWAAAPYLHNGSVPTLADLLKPSDQRPTSFAIGPNYDIEKVGLASEQTKFDYVLETTGCEDRNSGHSRCGHEYGTDLSEEEKKALLEYLKVL